MLDLRDVFKLILHFLPIFIAAICGLFILASLKGSTTRAEIRAKKVLLFYYFFSGLSLFTIFVYVYYPVTFVYLNAFCYLAFLMVQVLFYHLITILIQIDGKKSFSFLYYVPPIAISGALLLWSFFVPFDVQLALTIGKGEVIVQGYELYSYFFLSKVHVRFLFSIVCMGLILIQLRQYFHMVNEGRTLIRKPRPWIRLLMILSVALVLTTLFGAVISKGDILYSVLPIITICIFSSQFLILLCNFLRRNFLLYIVDDEPITAQSRMTGVNESSGITNALKMGKSTKTKMLDKKNFEDYFRKHKPFLNPNLKITDLIVPLNTNRAYISGYINKEYGMNFNRYINFCRLKELERLQNLRANQDKDIHLLASKVGFVNFRNYTRAISEQNVDTKDTTE